MCPLADWCNETDEAVGNHTLTILKGVQASLHIGRNAVAALVPSHYASEESIADKLQRLGKPAAAQFIRTKLPESLQIRSGDLGEILATEYIAERTTFAVPIKRLRWKDHREMAMRGDDVIAVIISDDGERPEFLKAESKSRQALAAAVVKSARDGLNKDGGLPSPHALSFVAERLRELGEIDLANAIDDAQFRDHIAPEQVSHMLFVMCGNDPHAHLLSDLNAYAGGMAQENVGLHIETHQDFIREVYEKVIADADDD
jgi:hypothetical protein